MTTCCALCDAPGGELLLQAARWRVVRVQEPLHPAFCRVIWQQHVREMTDLPPAQRLLLMQLVFATEAALRECFPTAKINLASLGNVTPHLHWHVIARFADDPHFPAPIWAEPRHRQPPRLPADWTTQLRAALQRHAAPLLADH